LSSVWLDRFAELMVMIGSVLIPVGGVFLAHFVVLRRPVDVGLVYDTDRLPRLNVNGIAAWAAGFIVYKLATPIGATLPALGTSIVTYLALTLWHPAPRAPQAP
jgi:purine-cytosine permease-like protein